MQERLERIKKLNEEKKTKKSRLEGRLETAKESMREYGCETLEQLEELLKENEEKLLKDGFQLDEKLKELEAYVQ